MYIIIIINLFYDDEIKTCLWKKSQLDFLLYFNNFYSYLQK